MRELIKFNAQFTYNNCSKENLSKREFTDIDATVAIVGDGIYNGVYFPTEELKKSLKLWDGKPLCFDHSESILSEIGYISNPRMVENKLVVDPHIADYTKYAQDALSWIRLRKEAGQIPEVSISAWVDVEDEEIEGKGRLRVARNIEPVHLSLVTQGACSAKDGCGIGISYSCEGGNWKVESSNCVVEEVDELKEKIKNGVVPTHPWDYGKDADTPWEKPRLEDFTSKAWGELDESEKRSIAGHFAWSPEMPPERFTDLKLPHHNPKSHAVNWRGVVAAMAALFGARGGVDIPSDDRKRVYNHLARHYEEFEKEPPEFEAMMEGGVEMAEKLLGELEEKKVEEAKVENCEIAELKRKVEAYEKAIEECKKAREELEKKYNELKAEFDKVVEEKKKLEEMRGKPKVANEKFESKSLVSEYERLKEIIKRI